MKKKPIFLYILLGLSTLGLLMNIYGFIQLPNILKAWNEFLTDETMLQQLGGVEVVKLQIATLEWSRSPLSLSLTATTTILFGVSAFFLFFKKDIEKSVYSYLAMRVAVLVSAMFAVMSSNQMARSLLKNKERLAETLNANKYAAIISVVIFLLLSALAYFGLRRYQKSLEDEVLETEVF
ncbi:MULTISPECIES: hypothetical protein [unclassified Streptococcus]|uniref:hypothetical protein n=1 Tax=unclassified Streptococcus TaxID=2608887 RepID=UPI001071B225|nr:MULTISPECIES: hypothetical protein [unclassified Streptococcus]MBF0806344.1 hypothetical protein [Streptococcus sp. 19428wA2_WM07]TFU28032.1 hypothetical protein E4T71_06070 [Streptococcus sp. WM07]